MVIIKLEVSAKQLAVSGLLVIRESVTDPDALSAEDGEYCNAEPNELVTEKLPDPLVCQYPPVAEPPMVGLPDDNV